MNKENKLVPGLPSGFEDRWDKKLLLKKKLLKAIEDNFIKFGAEALETPSFEISENIGSFLAEDEDNPMSDVFSIQDGEKSITLRYDLSSPLARFVAQNNQELPSIYKRYAIQNVFRNEKAGNGRYREFMQADFDIVCVAGDTVDLVDRSLPCPQQYNWDFGDPASGTNNTSTIKNPRHVFATPGLHTIKLTVSGPNNTPATISKDITILRANAFQKKPADCVTDQGGQAEVLVQGGSGQLFYNWNTIPAQVTTVASDLSSGIYLVQVSASNACPVTDTVLIVVDNNCGAIRFPSAFTPNRDGKNDGFGVLGGLGSIVAYRLSVYNRWGQVIFTTSDPAQRWNGTVKGITADPGIYIWMAELTLRNAPARTEKGSVVLIR